MRYCQSGQLHHSSKHLLQKHLMGHLMPFECLSLVVHKAVTQTGIKGVGSHLTILPSLGNDFVSAHDRANTVLMLGHHQYRIDTAVLEVTTLCILQYPVHLFPC